MNFLSLLGGGFTKTVSDLVDNLHTSEEEKLEAKLEMLKLNSEHYSTACYNTLLIILTCICYNTLLIVLNFHNVLLI